MIFIIYKNTFKIMKLNYNDIQFIISEATKRLTLEEGVGIDRFPTYGYCLIMAGGSGSGKSTLLATELQIQGKFFNIDDFRDDIEHLRRQKGTFDTKSFKTWKDKESKEVNDNNIDTFLKSQTNVLNNIIIDTTARDKKKTEELIEKIKSYGYKIGILWVATNRSVAIQRNIKRGQTPNKYGYKGRQVPDSGLHSTANSVMTNMSKYFNGPISKLIDDAWVVFTSGASLKDKEIPPTIKLTKTDKGFIMTDEQQNTLNNILGPKEKYTGNRGKTQTYYSSGEIQKMLNNGEDPENFLRIQEGIEWTNNNGRANLFINTKTDKKSNRGSNRKSDQKSWADTRIFNDTDDMISNTSKKIDEKQRCIRYYQSIIEYIKGGKVDKNIIQTYGVPDNILNATRYYYDTTASRQTKNGKEIQPKTDEEVIGLCNKAIEGYYNDNVAAMNWNNRAKATKNQTATKGDKQTPTRTAAYKLGVVPGTDIKYIGLFGMNEFNLSDAIKHGTIRQNDFTDKLLSIDPKSREKMKFRGLSSSPQKRLPVTYDDEITPDIENNFSLSGMELNVGDNPSLNDKAPDHQKQSFTQNDVNYTSPTQFLDKSIMYAAYALKKENFTPDFIVAAPSSSAFNHYYCVNLSRKMGNTYVPDFFTRNVVNVVYGDGKTREDMKKMGMKDNEIFDFENQVRSQMIAELTHIIQSPLKKFFEKYQNSFSDISRESHSREKYDYIEVYDCFRFYFLPTLMDAFKHDYIEKFIFDGIIRRTESVKGDKRLYNLIYDKIMKSMKKPFNKALEEVKALMTKYSEQIKTAGYEVSRSYEKFKITKVSSHLRRFLKNVYVVADKNLNEYGELYSRYANGKFLIFDEDIESGGTLKLVIDALKEKLPNANQQNLMCLVNAYKDDVKSH